MPPKRLPSRYITSFLLLLLIILLTSSPSLSSSFSIPSSRPLSEGTKTDPHRLIKTVSLFPHSHTDAGWIYPYNDYYTNKVRAIFTTVIDALIQSPDRRFIWADIMYFSTFWFESSTDIRKKLSFLIKNNQFEFVNGAMVMNDQAVVSYHSFLHNVAVAQDFIYSKFSKKVKYAWTIDPFGDASSQMSLWSEMGYKSALLSRTQESLRRPSVGADPNSAGTQVLWLPHGKIKGNQTPLLLEMWDGYTSGKMNFEKEFDLMEIELNKIHLAVWEYIYSTNGVMEEIKNRVEEFRKEGIEIGFYFEGDERLENGKQKDDKKTPPRQKIPSTYPEFITKFSPNIPIPLIPSSFNLYNSNSTFSTPILRFFRQNFVQILSEQLDQIRFSNTLHSSLPWGGDFNHMDAVRNNYMMDFFLDYVNNIQLFTLPDDFFISKTNCTKNIDFVSIHSQGYLPVGLCVHPIQGIVLRFQSPQLFQTFAEYGVELELEDQIEMEQWAGRQKSNGERQNQGGSSEINPSPEQMENNISRDVYTVIPRTKVESLGNSTHVKKIENSYDLFYPLGYKQNLDRINRNKQQNDQNTQNTQNGQILDQENQPTIPAYPWVEVVLKFRTSTNDEYFTAIQNEINHTWNFHGAGKRDSNQNSQKDKNNAEKNSPKQGTFTPLTPNKITKHFQNDFFTSIIPQSIFPWSISPLSYQETEQKIPDFTNSNHDQSLSASNIELIHQYYPELNYNSQNSIGLSQCVFGSSQTPNYHINFEQILNSSQNTPNQQQPTNRNPQISCSLRKFPLLALASTSLLHYSPPPPSNSTNDVLKATITPYLAVIPPLDTLVTLIRSLQFSLTVHPIKFAVLTAPNIFPNTDDYYEYGPLERTWSGFYTTRPWIKQSERRLQTALQSLDALSALSGSSDNTCVYPGMSGQLGQEKIDNGRELIGDLLWSSAFNHQQIPALNRWSDEYAKMVSTVTVEYGCIDCDEFGDGGEIFLNIRQNTTSTNPDQTSILSQNRLNSLIGRVDYLPGDVQSSGAIGQGYNSGKFDLSNKSYKIQPSCSALTPFEQSHLSMIRNLVTLIQHHDAITATSPLVTMQDYYQQITKASQHIDVLYSGYISDLLTLPRYTAGSTRDFIIELNQIVKDLKNEHEFVQDKKDQEEDSLCYSPEDSCADDVDEIDIESYDPIRALSGLISEIPQIDTTHHISPIASQNSEHSQATGDDITSRPSLRVFWSPSNNNLDGTQCLYDNTTRGSKLQTKMIPIVIHNPSSHEITHHIIKLFNITTTDVVLLDSNAEPVYSELIPVVFDGSTGDSGSNGIQYSNQPRSEPGNGANAKHDPKTAPFLHPSEQKVKKNHRLYGGEELKLSPLPRLSKSDLFSMNKLFTHGKLNFQGTLDDFFVSYFAQSGRDFSKNDTNSSNNSKDLPTSSTPLNSPIDLFMLSHYDDWNGYLSSFPHFQKHAPLTQSFLDFQRQLWFRSISGEDNIDINYKNEYQPRYSVYECSILQSEISYQTHINHNNLIHGSHITTYFTRLSEFVLKNGYPTISEIQIDLKWSPLQASHYTKQHFPHLIPLYNLYSSPVRLPALSTKVMWLVLNSKQGSCCQAVNAYHDVEGLFTYQKQPNIRFTRRYSLQTSDQISLLEKHQKDDELRNKDSSDGVGGVGGNNDADRLLFGSDFVNFDNFCHFPVGGGIGLDLYCANTSPFHQAYHAPLLLSLPWREKLAPEVNGGDKNESKNPDGQNSNQNNLKFVSAGVCHQDISNGRLTLTVEGSCGYTLENTIDPSYTVGGTTGVIIQQQEIQGLFHPYDYSIDKIDQNGPKNGKQNQNEKSSSKIDSININYHTPDPTYNHNNLPLYYQYYANAFIPALNTGDQKGNQTKLPSLLSHAPSRYSLPTITPFSLLFIKNPTPYTTFQAHYLYTSSNPTIRPYPAWFREVFQDTAQSNLTPSPSQTINVPNTSNIIENSLFSEFDAISTSLLGKTPTPNLTPSHLLSSLNHNQLFSASTSFIIESYDSSYLINPFSIQTNPNYQKNLLFALNNYNSVYRYGDFAPVARIQDGMYPNYQGQSISFHSLPKNPQDSNYTDFENARNRPMPSGDQAQPRPGQQPPKQRIDHETEIQFTGSRSFVIKGLVVEEFVTRSWSPSKSTMLDTMTIRHAVKNSNSFRAFRRGLKTQNGEETLKNGNIEKVTTPVHCACSRLVPKHKFYQMSVLSGSFLHPECPCFEKQDKLNSSPPSSLTTTSERLGADLLGQIDHLNLATNTYLGDEIAQKTQLQQKSISYHKILRIFRQTDSLHFSLILHSGLADPMNIFLRIQTGVENSVSLDGSRQRDSLRSNIYVDDFGYNLIQKTYSRHHAANGNHMPFISQVMIKDESPSLVTHPALAMLSEDNVRWGGVGQDADKFERNSPQQGLQIEYNIVKYSLSIPRGYTALPSHVIATFIADQNDGQNNERNNEHDGKNTKNIYPKTHYYGIRQFAFISQRSGGVNPVASGSFDIMLNRYIPGQDYLGVQETLVDLNSINFHGMFFFSTNSIQKNEKAVHSNQFIDLKHHNSVDLAMVESSNVFQHHIKEAVQYVLGKWVRKNAFSSPATEVPVRTSEVPARTPEASIGTSNTSNATHSTDSLSDIPKLVKRFVELLTTTTTTVPYQNGGFELSQNIRKYLPQMTGTGKESNKSNYFNQHFGLFDDLIGTNINSIYNHLIDTTLISNTTKLPLDFRNFPLTFANLTTYLNNLSEKADFPTDSSAIESSESIIKQLDQLLPFSYHINLDRIGTGLFGVGIRGLFFDPSLFSYSPSYRQHYTSKAVSVLASPELKEATRTDGSYEDFGVGVQNYLKKRDFSGFLPFLEYHIAPGDIHYTSHLAHTIDLRDRVLSFTQYNDRRKEMRLSSQDQTEGDLYFSFFPARNNGKSVNIPEGTFKSQSKPAKLGFKEYMYHSARVNIGAGASFDNNSKTFSRQEEKIDKKNKIDGRNNPNIGWNPTISNPYVYPMTVPYPYAVPIHLLFSEGSGQSLGYADGSSYSQFHQMLDPSINISHNGNVSDKKEPFLTDSSTVFEIRGNLLDPGASKRRFSPPRYSTGKFWYHYHYHKTQLKFESILTTYSFILGQNITSESLIAKFFNNQLQFENSETIDHFLSLAQDISKPDHYWQLSFNSPQNPPDVSNPATDDMFIEYLLTLLGEGYYYMQFGASKYLENGHYDTNFNTLIAQNIETYFDPNFDIQFDETFQKSSQLSPTNKLSASAIRNSSLHCLNRHLFFGQYRFICENRHIFTSNFVQNSAAKKNKALYTQILPFFDPKHTFIQQHILYLSQFQLPDIINQQQIVLTHHETFLQMVQFSKLLTSQALSNSSSPSPKSLAQNFNISLNFVPSQLYPSPTPSSFEVALGMDELSLIDGLTSPLFKTLNLFNGGFPCQNDNFKSISQTYQNEPKIFKTNGIPLLLTSKTKFSHSTIRVLYAAISQLGLNVMKKSVDFVLENTHQQIAANNQLINFNYKYHIPYLTPLPSLLRSGPIIGPKTLFSALSADTPLDKCVNIQTLQPNCPLISPDFLSLSKLPHGPADVGFHDDGSIPKIIEENPGRNNQIPMSPSLEASLDSILPIRIRLESFNTQSLYSHNFQQRREQGLYLASMYAGYGQNLGLVHFDNVIITSFLHQNIYSQAIKMCFSEADDGEIAQLQKFIFQGVYNAHLFREQSGEARQSHIPLHPIRSFSSGTEDGANDGRGLGGFIQKAFDFIETDTNLCPSLLPFFGTPFRSNITLSQRTGVESNQTDYLSQSVFTSNFNSVLDKLYSDPSFTFWSNAQEKEANPRALISGDLSGHDYILKTYFSIYPDFPITLQDSIHSLSHHQSVLKFNENAISVIGKFKQIGLTGVTSSVLNSQMTKEKVVAVFEKTPKKILTKHSQSIHPNDSKYNVAANSTCLRSLVAPSDLSSTSDRSNSSFGSKLNDDKNDTKTNPKRLYSHSIHPARIICPSTPVRQTRGAVNLIGQTGGSFMTPRLWSDMYVGSGVQNEYYFEFINGKNNNISNIELDSKFEKSSHIKQTKIRLQVPNLQGNQFELGQNNKNPSSGLMFEFDTLDQCTNALTSISLTVKIEKTSQNGQFGSLLQIMSPLGQKVVSFIPNDKSEFDLVDQMNNDSIDITIPLGTYMKNCFGTYPHSNTNPGANIVQKMVHFELQQRQNSGKENEQFRLTSNNNIDSLNPLSNSQHYQNLSKKFIADTSSIDTSLYGDLIYPSQVDLNPFCYCSGISHYNDDLMNNFNPQPDPSDDIFTQVTAAFPISQNPLIYFPSPLTDSFNPWGDDYFDVFERSSALRSPQRLHFSIPPSGIKTYHTYLYTNTIYVQSREVYNITGNNHSIGNLSPPKTDNRQPHPIDSPQGALHLFDYFAQIDSNVDVTANTGDWDRMGFDKYIKSSLESCRAITPIFSHKTAPTLLTSSQLNHNNDVMNVIQNYGPDGGYLISFVSDFYKKSQFGDDKNNDENYHQFLALSPSKGILPQSKSTHHHSIALQPPNSFDRDLLEHIQKVLSDTNPKDDANPPRSGGSGTRKDDEKDDNHDEKRLVAMISLILVITILLVGIYNGVRYQIWKSFTNRMKYEKVNNDDTIDDLTEVNLAQFTSHHSFDNTIKDVVVHSSPKRPAQDQFDELVSPVFDVPAQDHITSSGSTNLAIIPESHVATISTQIATSINTNRLEFDFCAEFSENEGGSDVEGGQRVMNGGFQSFNTMDGFESDGL